MSTCWVPPIRACFRNKSKTWLLRAWRAAGRRMLWRVEANIDRELCRRGLL
jgi:hypothetical protein